MREESARLWFRSRPKFEQRDDSLREGIMNDPHPEDDDDQRPEDDQEDDDDAISSKGAFGMKQLLTMTTPKADAYRAVTVTTPMTAAMTPMTPSPIQLPSSSTVLLSPNPTAPGPRNSYHGNNHGNGNNNGDNNSALSDLQQGYLVNSKQQQQLLSPQVQVKCRALFRDTATTPDATRPLHHVLQSSVVVPSNSTIQNYSCRRQATRLLDTAPTIPMATPFGISERRRSSTTRDNHHVSSDHSLPCSPPTSPRSAVHHHHQRSNSKTFFRRSSSSSLNINLVADTPAESKQRYTNTTSTSTTLRPRRNLLTWTLGLVALSSAGTLLMTSWSLNETSTSSIQNQHPQHPLLVLRRQKGLRPDLRYSDAGLRGKMVQTAGQQQQQQLNKDNNPKRKTKAAQKNSHVSTAITNKHKKEAPKQHQHKPKTAAAVAPHAVVVGVDATSRTQSSPSQTTTTRYVVHMPPKITSMPQQGNFENQDPTMYDRRGTHKPKPSSSSSNGSRPRIVSLDESSFGQTTTTATLPTVAAPPSSHHHGHHRTIKQYPADFSDNTQLYSILSSSDERLTKMEQRQPYSNGECIPMQDWQTTFYPVCNDIHEIGMTSTLVSGNGGKSNHNGNDDDIHLFGTKGYWRNAWRLDLLGGNNKVEDRDTAVLKTLKFQHNFEDAHFEHDRIDAVAMERLTSSPHVINVFGFCGHSVLTEYADGARVGELADKSKKKPLVRLKIARDIANGLADVHGIDGDGNATFVHLDINPANVVSVGGTLKLNDFNIGIIRRWNTTSNTPCGFPAQYPNPQWRSPEEARDEQNLTEKVDIFSMGHIFFRLICGHEPWNKLEPGGKPAKEEIDQKVRKGELPFIPAFVMNTLNKEVIAIREAMLRCYAVDPLQRPSAREIARTLELTLNSLQDSAEI